MCFISKKFIDKWFFKNALNGYGMEGLHIVNCQDTGPGELNRNTNSGHGLG